MILPPQIRESGFAAITLLLFLPLICLIIFSFAFVSHVIQYKTKTRTLCIQGSIAIEKNIAQAEENLFQLNPIATSLRSRLQIALIELAFAIATENPILAAEAEIKIQQIKIEQKNLDAAQKLIIFSASAHLKILTQKLIAELSDLSLRTASNWDFYLKCLGKVRLLRMPVLAVRPDSTDWAPVYELLPDYIALQKVAFNWQYLFHTRNDAQEVLKSRNEYELSCESSAKKESGKWKFLIAVDKY